MRPRIEQLINESIAVKARLLQEEGVLKTVNQVIDLLVETFQEDRKVLLCGNGGSAADAQHIASELSGRFYMDRPPLFAEALHVNTSALTAIANDYGFEEIFSRMLMAKGREKDVLIALSTSGNSLNIVRAITAAKDQKMTVVGMTGASGGAMGPLCDYLIPIPSDDTPRVQECHLMLGHLICEALEQELFNK